MKETVILVIAIVLLTMYDHTYIFEDEVNANISKCDKMRCPIDSKIQITDRSNLWYKHKGIAKNRVSNCQYMVKNLCDESRHDYFLKELKGTK